MCGWGEDHEHKRFKKLSLGLLPFLDHANEMNAFIITKLASL